MKKKIGIAIGIILVLVVCYIMMDWYEEYKRKTKIGEFDIAKYENRIQEFNRNENVGKVSTRKEAIKKAEELWSKEFKVDDTPKIYKIEYDKENEVWLVEQSGYIYLRKMRYVLVKKDGTVLAIWQESVYQYLQ